MSHELKHRPPMPVSPRDSSTIIEALQVEMLSILKDLDDQNNGFPVMAAGGGSNAGEGTSIRNAIFTVAKETTRSCVSELKGYNGTLDAIENSLLDIEQYFCVERIQHDRRVSIATMFLGNDVELWWRTKYDEIR